MKCIQDYEIKMKITWNFSNKKNLDCYSVLLQSHIIYEYFFFFFHNFFLFNNLFLILLGKSLKNKLGRKNLLILIKEQNSNK